MPPKKQSRIRSTLHNLRRTSSTHLSCWTFEPWKSRSQLGSTGPPWPRVSCPACRFCYHFTRRFERQTIIQVCISLSFQALIMEDSRTLHLHQAKDTPTCSNTTTLNNTTEKLPAMSARSVEVSKRLTSCTCMGGGHSRAAMDLDNNATQRRYPWFFSFSF